MAAPNRSGWHRIAEPFFFAFLSQIKVRRRGGEGMGRQSLAPATPTEKKNDWGGLRYGVTVSAFW